VPYLPLIQEPGTPMLASERFAFGWSPLQNSPSSGMAWDHWEHASQGNHAAARAGSRAEL